MNEKTLWIMCGCPGSGKSTWLRQNAFENSVVISRDAIRFAMLDGEDEAEYFKYEDKVWNKFINDIRTALTQSDNVYVDATHINEVSRMKLIKRVDLSKCKVNCIVLLTDELTAIKRNHLREGRARVPDSVISENYARFTHPKTDKFHYHTIIEVN